MSRRVDHPQPRLKVDRLDGQLCVCVDFERGRRGSGPAPAAPTPLMLPLVLPLLPVLPVMTVVAMASPLTLLAVFAVPALLLFLAQFTQELAVASPALSVGRGLGGRAGITIGPGLMGVIILCGGRCVLRWRIHCVNRHREVVRFCGER